MHWLWYYDVSIYLSNLPVTQISIIIPVIYVRYSFPLVAKFPRIYQACPSEPFTLITRKRRLRGDQFSGNNEDLEG